MKLILPIIFFILSACGQFSMSEDHSAELDIQESQEASARVDDPETNEVRKPSTEASQNVSEDDDSSESEEQTDIEEKQQQDMQKPTEDKANEEIVEDAPPCIADDSLSTPKTIEDAVALINALPMPVSIVCFLQALKKPFKLVATRSNLSAQPADGEETPRFFLFYEQLIISVVPGGEGKDLVEFSYLLSSRESIKGELEFPVKTQLNQTKPYTTSLNRKGDGSRCAVCHVNERPVSADFPAFAFVSKALKPMNTQISRQFTLDKILTDCQSTKNERCDMIKALLSAPYEVTSFPEAMPTFF